MSSKESIDKAIEHFRKAQTELLEHISNLSVISREKLIQEDYASLLHQEAEWYTTFMDNSTTFNTLQNINQHNKKINNNNNAIGELLQSIEMDSKSKYKHLSEFLGNIKGIDPGDRQIILENLISLSNTDLETELTNLVQIFSEE